MTFDRTDAASHDSRRNPRRSHAALLLVAVLAVASAGALVRSEPVPGADVTAFEKRLAPLRRALPMRGTVGYVSDTDFAGVGYMTQYALAPLVLYPYRPGFAPPVTGPTLVVGVFDSPTLMHDVIARNGLIVTRDLGDGLLLLEPKAR